MKRKHLIGGITVLSLIVVSVAGAWMYRASQASKPLSEWDLADDKNQETIDHGAWQILLDDFLETETDYGVNQFDYESLQIDAIGELDDYINALSDIDPRQYSRDEQFAYWVNLYNAATVDLIVENFPVDSITELGETPLAFGPWDDPRVTVAGVSLTLNNIEHGILRPIFKDPRIHFAVNCASIGCPNLQGEAFTSANLEELLSNSAQEFVNHSRAVQINENTLMLSSIFDWYAEDFGEDSTAILKSIAQFSDSEAASLLVDFNGEIEYHYDWQLNGSDF